jgi:hypothetical protein
MTVHVRNADFLALPEFRNFHTKIPYYMSKTIVYDTTDSQSLVNFEI